MRRPEADSPDAQKLLQERLQGWEPDLTGTLLFLRDDDNVLLIRKKRGHGAGKINGPGGKLDPGETPAAGAVRETFEETGIEVLDPVLHGRFRFLDLKSLQWFGYVFLARSYQGELIETEEALPFWCPLGELPFAEMWEDDRLWLPRLLAGEHLEGDFLFDDGRLLAHRLNTVSN